MNQPDFVYTTYIRSTPEKVWAAITNPEFTRQYWGGKGNHSDWKSGSRWQHLEEGDPEAWVEGVVEESQPPRRLVITWFSPDSPEDVSRVTFEIEEVESLVRLNVVHGDFTPDSIMAGKVKGGWPLVLSSLKSFLETGTPIDIGCAKCAAPKQEEAVAATH